MIDPLLALACFAGGYAGSALWAWSFGRLERPRKPEDRQFLEPESRQCDGSSSGGPYREPGVIDNLLSTIDRGGRETHTTCVGYVTPSQTMMDDCKAKQSDACEDGRCSFHCAKMCKCDPTVTHVSERAVWRK